MAFSIGIGKRIQLGQLPACDDLLMITPSIFHRFMLRQLLLPVLGCMVALGLPVVLVALLGHLPAAALGSQLVWSALYGIVPTALYLTLPVAIGLGTTWGYAQLNADGMFTTIQTMRLSIGMLAVPSLILATPVVVMTYAISCWIAPRSVTNIQDIMFLIRNNINFDLFYPQKFYTIANNRYTIYFNNKMGDNWISGVFFYEERGHESSQTIIADAARIETRNDERHVVFLNGHMHTIRNPEQPADTLAFSELVRPFGADGGAVLPQRNWRGLFEMDTAEFWNAWQETANSPTKRKAWISEAIKRFAVPVLGIIHPLAGLALVLNWRRRGGRRQRDPLWYGMPVVLLHLCILFSAEGVAYYGAWLGGLTALLIVAEFVIAAGAIYYRQWRVPA